MQQPPTIIVLAAGPGRRFGAGGHKLVQPLGGRSVLVATLDNAIETGWPVCVVLTPALLPLVAPWVQARDRVVLDEDDAARGLGRSIAAAVTAQADAAGWVALPGDMPLVRPQTIHAVGRSLAEHPVAYAQYRGRICHPQAFAAELFSDLRELQGEAGARRLLARYPAAAVDVDDPGVLVDVDTEADLEAARSAVAQGKAERSGEAP